MESLTSGTLAGAGSFRCEQCGYVLTLAASDELAECPGCGGRNFVRASLFSTGGLEAGSVGGHEGGLTRPDPADRKAWLEQARAAAEQPGEYLSYEDGAEQRTIPLTREWTRIGRSLVADVRFDDATVSRRHALIVRQPDGVRVLDDRSLNGVFVNGRRVEGEVLRDGDEIIVGRYRLTFLSVVPETNAISQAPSAQPAG
jgi:DNA-directed RNA polymerase subunit RPC12/RpoP